MAFYCPYCHSVDSVLTGNIYCSHGAGMERPNKDGVKASTGAELYKRVRTAKEYMDANYTLDITLEDIARNGCLSVSHFKRLFKEYYHTTPHQYIIQRRLEKARELLISSDMPVRNICCTIGFGNTSSFIRLFRTSFDDTPLKYRDKNIAQNDTGERSLLLK